MTFLVCTGALALEKGAPFAKFCISDYSLPCSHRHLHRACLGTSYSRRIWQSIYCLHAFVGECLESAASLSACRTALADHPDEA